MKQTYGSEKQNVAFSQTPKPRVSDRVAKGEGAVCFNCRKVGHKANVCPDRKVPVKTERAYHLEKAESKRHGNSDKAMQGKICHLDASILVDTGADVSVIREGLVCPQHMTGAKVSVRGFGSEETTYPTAKVTVELGPLSIDSIAAVAPDGYFDNLDMLLGLSVDSPDLAELVQWIRTEKSTISAQVNVVTRAQAKADALEDQAVLLAEKVPKSPAEHLQSESSSSGKESSESVVEEISSVVSQNGSVVDSWECPIVTRGSESQVGFVKAIKEDTN